MSKNLVIVESPTKAKTISKFLGKNYKITSSYGHLRDLPQKSLGVDVKHDFQPKYVVAKDKKAIVDELKKMAKKSETVYFATDEDREGEAIAWHLLYLLSKGNKNLKHKRIAFHEITKKAVLDALKKPREIDNNLVDAQQARRILDRLVGYKLSPFLWKKVAKGLSAGRVQSVAVRLIVEREQEIKKFKSQEYWSLKAHLNKDKETFESLLNQIDDKKLDKLDIKDKKQMDKIIKDLDKTDYVVDKIAKRQAKKNPPAPYTTSSLQQDAHNKLGFSSRQTMYLAQSLYEGMKVGKEHVGLITYMRTDSQNLASSFVDSARQYIQKEFSAKYLPSKPVTYKTKSKTAQEAHEAIRPTHIDKTPDQVKDHLKDKEFKLYQLIWQRSLACQMQAAQLDHTTVDIKADNYTFRATGSIIKFKGFLEVYGNNNKDNILPELKEKDKLNLKKLEPKQHFT